MAGEVGIKNELTWEYSCCDGLYCGNDYVRHPAGFRVFNYVLNDFSIASYQTFQGFKSYMFANGIPEFKAVDNGARRISYSHLYAIYDVCFYPDIQAFT